MFCVYTTKEQDVGRGVDERSLKKCTLIKNHVSVCGGILWGVGLGELCEKEKCEN